MFCRQNPLTVYELSDLGISKEKVKNSEMQITYSIMNQQLEEEFYKKYIERNLQHTHKIDTFLDELIQKR